MSGASASEMLERLIAILDWADFALAHPDEFNSNGVKNLEGPIFDEARLVVAKAAGDDGDSEADSMSISCMTLRDHFAAQALVGLIANPNNTGSSQKVAEIAFGIADAMLVMREASPTLKQLAGE